MFFNKSFKISHQYFNKEMIRNNIPSYKRLILVFYELLIENVYFLICSSLIYHISHNSKSFKVINDLTIKFYSSVTNIKICYCLKFKIPMYH